MKSGITHEAMLNYNSILEAMVIAPPGSPFVTLADLENVDAVYIQDRKFIPSDKIFYEVVSDASFPYLIHYTCRVIPPGHAVGFGGTSQLSNTSASVVKQLAPFYYLKLPGDYQITPQSNIIVERGGKYRVLSSYKKVGEVFPGKEEAIKRFVKENKTDFNAADDVKKLLHFLQ